MRHLRSLQSISSSTIWPPWNLSQSPNGLGPLFPWISSLTFPWLVATTRCSSWSIASLRWPIFSPCAKTFTGEEKANLFFKNVVQLHGLPDDITSDRGPQFVSKFWRRLLQTFGCTVNLSSAHHQQTDGQTERVNQILEQYLRCSLIYQQDDWVGLLPLVEFVYNSSLHASMGITPFFSNHSLHPCFNISLPSNTTSQACPRRSSGISWPISTKTGRGSLEVALEGG